MFYLPSELNTDADTRWRALLEAMAQAGIVPPSFDAKDGAIAQALVFSDFLTQQLVRDPHLLGDLLDSGDLHAEYSGRDMQERLIRIWQRKCASPPFQIDASGSQGKMSQEGLMGVLRLFRRREMVRICLRDICGWSDLDHTMTDLSALADITISAALEAFYHRGCRIWGEPRDSDGKPVQLVVIGLGKLGANELNFSSDVDLMFAYPSEGETTGGEKGTETNEAFFTRLCRDLIKAIGGSTADGFVFRVDTRLRPYGEAGPLAMTFDRLEDYYQDQGREWERYAMIKARVVAGDHEAGRHLLERLKPFVFRRYLDYGAFESLRDMKARIAAEVRGKGLQDNIKMGSGGIREIEFFGQMFQLIRGGVDSQLQIRPIRKVLAVLVGERYIPESVGKAMDSAYVFLRNVENRLQEWADQQTHSLPKDTVGCRRLAAAMGFEGWNAFREVLDGHRHWVHIHFNELLASVDEGDASNPEKEELAKLSALWQGVLEEGQGMELLEQAGYRDPQAGLQQIEALRNDRVLQTLTRIGRERLKRLVPMLLRAVGRADRPDQVLGRVFELIRSIQRRTSYLALLIENPSVITHLVELAGASPWIASFLGRHPVLLDELLDVRTLYRPPQRGELESDLRQRLACVDDDDLEYQMEVLRVFKQVNVLRVAASDIMHVLPLMKVSDHLSDIAETVVAEVVQLCFEQLAAKYGQPVCRIDQGSCDRGFAVVAYGKLGGLELGYGSDLDLVFLHAAEPGETCGSGRTMDNAQFFSRLGQRVLHMFTTHTGAGILYEADMRLRPSGDSGMLVSHVNGFAAYQREDAWTWEHQALIRARCIVGDPAVKLLFDAIRLEILTRPRDTGQLRQEVAEMRVRLRKEYKGDSVDTFDIKQDPGGIIDIEFLVQYLVLGHAHHHPEIVRWTDNVRLLQALNEAGILDDETAFRLRRAYLIYRAMAHRLNLRQQSAQVGSDRFQRPRRFITDVWNRFLSPPEIALP